MTNDICLAIDGSDLLCTSTERAGVVCIERWNCRRDIAQASLSAPADGSDLRPSEICFSCERALRAEGSEMCAWCQREAGGDYSYL